MKIKYFSHETLSEIEIEIETEIETEIENNESI
jgi:hypothetical protein